MSDVLAIIPARAGSKGIPGKNFRELVGLPPVTRAVCCALHAGVTPLVTSDYECAFEYCTYNLRRPAELAQDDTPMIDVVKHALEQIPGPDEQIVLLVQPTQPLRRPEHLTKAIDLLRGSGADSVVSVVALPPTHHPAWQARILNGRLEQSWTAEVTRRQDLAPVYIRDGTVYAFTRHTVNRYHNIYGQDCRPLIIPAEDTCPLDTMADWAEAERRLRAREATPAHA